MSVPIRSVTVLSSSELEGAVSIQAVSRCQGCYLTGFNLVVSLSTFFDNLRVQMQISECTHERVFVYSKKGTHVISFRKTLGFVMDISMVL